MLDVVSARIVNQGVLQSDIAKAWYTKHQDTTDERVKMWVIDMEQRFFSLVSKKAGGPEVIDQNAAAIIRKAINQGE